VCGGDKKKQKAAHTSAESSGVRRSRVDTSSVEYWRVLWRERSARRQRCVWARLKIRCCHLRRRRRNCRRRRW